MQFSYVYILRSEVVPARFYVGLTDDLHSRLQKHNNGDVPYTAKFRPWKIKTAIAFADRERAAELERYLKRRRANSKLRFARRFHPRLAQRSLAGAERGLARCSSGDGRITSKEISE